MTALKPIESRDVRAATLETDTYLSNTICAVPGCQEKVELRPDGTPTVHHAFPKSQIKSDSYYVVIDVTDAEKDRWALETGEHRDSYPIESEPIPHAFGLCGSGTTGHHGDVEEHRAWLKLEDGVWNWYQRDASAEIDTRLGAAWVLLGSMDPQPGLLAAVEKKKRRVFKGEDKRNRQNWQIKVPVDALEDGAGILDDLLEQVRGVEEVEELYPEGEEPPYYILVAALNLLLQNQS